MKKKCHSLKNSAVSTTKSGWNIFHIICFNLERKLKQLFQPLIIVETIIVLQPFISVETQIKECFNRRTSPQQLFFHMISTAAQHRNIFLIKLLSLCCLKWNIARWYFTICLTFVIYFGETSIFNLRLIKILCVSRSSSHFW